MAGRVVTVAAGTTTIKTGEYTCKQCHPHMGVGWHSVNRGNEDIVEVIFPASLRTLETFAFAGCSRIKRIDLSHTRVTAIGRCAFAHCTSLTEVIFPDTLLHMERACFLECTATTAVDLNGAAAQQRALELCASALHP